MYLRHTTRHKDGKAHTYWRLVRSVRRGSKVYQETVAQLGELDARGRAKARALARTITGQAEQQELFEETPARDEAVRVRLKDYRIRSVTMGKDAQGEVSVEVEHKGRRITARGISTDIIQASGLAYVKAINTALARQNRGKTARVRKMCS